MKELIEKYPEQIKEQIEFWFLKYYGKHKNDFNGSEIFTLFDLLDEKDKNVFINKVRIDKPEIPVLILKVTDTEFIINTTERFIQLDNSNYKSINYKEFAGHKGYEIVTIIKDISGRKVADVKQEGKIYDFGLIKRNGDMIFWKIPTGESGFGFWNVTKRCELIGRKYKVIV